LSDIFGEPGQGFHKKRLFGLAKNDLLLTLLLVVIITYVNYKGSTLKQYIYGLVMTFLLMMTIVMCIHKMFCVDTALNRFLWF
jgi:hypothetical protein